LRASTSSYVHFHDADDLFYSDWCRHVRTVITDQDPDVVFTEVQSFGTDTVGSDRVLGLGRLQQGEDLARFCIEGAMLTPSGTYRRECVLGIGGYRIDLVQSEDWDFHIRLAASGVRYAIIGEPLVRQRLRASGRHQRGLEVWTSCCAAIEGLAEQLPRTYRPDLAEAAARAGSQLFALGARAEARGAFELARRLGPVRTEHRPRAYALLARTVGFEAAERVALAYRRLLPNELRAHIAGHG
jgi:hypothetical protein